MKSAQAAGGPVALSCDDSWGLEEICSDDDYDHLVIRRDMLRRDHNPFVDAGASFSWRVFCLARPGG